MFTDHAFQVVQNTLVQYRAHLGAGDTTGGGTNQAADEGTGNTAQGGTSRTTDKADGHANACPGDGTGPASNATGDGADGATGFTAEVSGHDSLGTTVRTLNAHDGGAFVKRVSEEMTDARVPAIQRGTGMEVCGITPRTYQRLDWTAWGNYSGDGGEIRSTKRESASRASGTG